MISNNHFREVTKLIGASKREMIQTGKKFLNVLVAWIKLVMHSENLKRCSMRLEVMKYGDND
jgi:hypothetical protein